MTNRSRGKAKVGRSSVRRGEIRWYTFALPDKRRPVLILSRDSVLPHLNEIIVVPATRTIRGIDTEVVLTEDDGMPAACAVNLDHVSLARKERLGATITNLAESRWGEVERALLVACGFADRE
jgi:mRNA interferase MazF